MSKRGAIGEIINAGQAELLDLMRDAPGRLSRAALLEASSLHRTMLNRHLVGLVECDLADAAKAGELAPMREEHRGRTALMYSITRAGSRALARYKRKLEDADKVLVEPPKNNMFARPDYEPHSGAYYRNAGNKHIQSRGFSC